MSNELSDWLKVFTVVAVPVIGGLFGFLKWLKHRQEAERRFRYEHQKDDYQRERDNLARLLDAQKPFLSKQLDLYHETASEIADRKPLIRGLGDVGETILGPILERAFRCRAPDS